MIVVHFLDPSHNARCAQTARFAAHTAPAISKARKGATLPKLKKNGTWVTQTTSSLPDIHPLEKNNNGSHANLLEGSPYHPKNSQNAGPKGHMGPR